MYVYTVLQHGGSDSNREKCVFNLRVLAVMLALYAYRNVWPVNRREMTWTSNATVQNKITPYCFKTIHCG